MGSSVSTQVYLGVRLPDLRNFFKIVRVGDPDPCENPKCPRPSEQKFCGECGQENSDQYAVEILSPLLEGFLEWEGCPSVESPSDKADLTGALEHFLREQGEYGDLGSVGGSDLIVFPVVWVAGAYDGDQFAVGIRIGDVSHYDQADGTAPEPGYSLDDLDEWGALLRDALEPLDVEGPIEIFPMAYWSC